ncbi:MAG TPA: pyruvate kinase [Solirubrobacteraceae bacterium]|nr:pyruvate kinase [Solirubrobacteraceae bacterium]
MAHPADLIESLEDTRERLLEAAEGWRPWSDAGTSDRDASARNLLQYLALRRQDLRELQDPLVELGLSSLGRCEGHVQASVDAVLTALDALANHQSATRNGPPPPIDFAASRRLLTLRTDALLGPAPGGRPTRIMVTMPSDAARDAAAVRDMLHAGMNCMRINCAHDTPSEWRAMVENLRAAEHDTRRRARAVVDLPGPKLRTGALAREGGSDHSGGYLRLRIGDRLVLARETNADASGEPSLPRITCSIEEAFTATRPGHHVWFDDGKLGGVVESVDPNAIELRITSAKPSGSKLRAGKGINLPDASLDIDLLGAHSHDALEFAADCADIVGLSFVSRAREVERVHRQLDQRGRPDIGIVLKIETRRAFAHLPGLLLAALSGERPAGVMIARGDLAVECGYERLAEVQEEILWLCQAAHLPVIWATQVLDQLARTGRPSRAEITDAAMAVRAECVMLNKGPRIVEAIAVLDDILRRMEKHQRKKRPLLPRLSVSDYEHALP